MSNVSLSLAASLLLLAATPSFATTITLFNSPVVQDFNTLPITGSSHTELPSGWFFYEVGPLGNNLYGTGTGSSTTGNTYSLGELGSSERALGTLRTGSVDVSIGTQITNQTGGVITSLEVTYFGEQWRLAGLERSDQLDFAYSTDASSLFTGTWLDVNELDYVAPLSYETYGQRNGNLPANRSEISFTLTGLNLENGSSLWFRWSDYVVNGPNDVLGIDDVSITAFGIEPPDTPVASVPETLPSSYIVFMMGLLCAASAARRGWGFTS